MPTYNPKTIETYDRIAKRFSDSHFDTSFWKKEFGIFKKLMRGKKVIDIGCGAGRDAVLFMKHNFDYIGIDASAGMLREARKRVRGGKFVKMDFYELKFSPSVFDGFWAAASILHIPKSKVTKVLCNIRQILKPGGIGFISLKEKRSLDEGVVRESRHDGIQRYFSFYRKGEFLRFLKAANFKVVKSHTLKEGDTNWLCYFVKKSGL